MNRSPDVGRLSQLSAGMRAAAAALPTDHQPIRERVTSLAERLQAAAGRLPADASQNAGSTLGDAVADVERLHFDLIVLTVHGGDPTSLGIGTRLDGLEAVAASLEEEAASASAE